MPGSSSVKREGWNQVVYKPSLASLPLQISLYYNCLFSILFAIVVGSCSVNKILFYNKKVSISVLSVWSFIEPFRLYYGYSGNLRERVADLATYLLMTLFPQLPFILYLGKDCHVRPSNFFLSFCVFGGKQIENK